MHKTFYSLFLDGSLCFNFKMAVVKEAVSQNILLYLVDSVKGIKKFMFQI